MDLGLNVNRASYNSNTGSNISIAAVQKSTNVSSASNPALDGLSSLLADPSKIGGKDNNEDEIKSKLVSIDNEMAEMQRYLDEINQMGELSMEARAKVLANLEAMSTRLKQIGQELEELAQASRQRSTDSKNQYTQLSTIDLLKTQIDAQRELLKSNSGDGDVQQASAPTPPQAI